MTPAEQIKERLSILDVVGSYVELTKAGKQYKGKSPFTNEKTPSFFVSPDRGMYYCFSSQKGGDMFTFIEEMEGVDFRGALKILAEKAGVALVPEDPKKRSEREAQYALLAEAAHFFFKEREAHPDVTTYAEARGVVGKTFHLWQIGYAPGPQTGGWRVLKTHLKEKGFREEQIQRAGLIKRSEGSVESYDVFRDRLMFPICDSSGRVVAFSGRAMHTDEKTPKYVNSPETELFLKSKILYGYDKAKQGIRTYDFSLIVEGQFDVVLAHQAGYTNAVAVSGTALSADHITLLERLSSRVVLALDSDRAGVSAVKRSAEIMFRRGMDVKVAELPEGADPADLINADPANFKKVVGASVHAVSFLLTVLKRATQDERAYKLRVREEVLPLLVSMSNRIDRDHFEGVIAEAIDTKKDAVHYEIERLQDASQIREATNRTAENTRTVHMQKNTRRENLQKDLYALSLVLDASQQTLSDRIISHLSELLSSDEYQTLSSMPETEASKLMFLAEQYFARERSDAQLAREVSEKLTELSHLVARAWLAELRPKIEEAERAGDHEALTARLNETKRAETLLQQTIEVA